MEEIMQWLFNAGVIDVMRVASSILASWWFRCVCIAFIVYNVYEYCKRKNFDKDKSKEFYEYSFSSDSNVSFYMFLLAFFDNDKSKVDVYLKNEYTKDSSISDDINASFRILNTMGLMQIRSDGVYWCGPEDDLERIIKNLSKLKEMGY